MSSIETFSPEWVRLAFVLGMVLSVFLYEKSHLTTGSIVVPGFLGIHFLEPITIATCLLNAWLCFWLIHRLAPRFWLMSNRSKFHALIIVSVIVQMAWQLLAQMHHPVAVGGQWMGGLGFVIPGLIAHDMSRHGPFKTVLNATAISTFVGAIVFTIIMVDPSRPVPSHALSRAPNYDLVLMLTLSTLVSVVLKLNTNLRSGGYVTPAYILFFMTSPQLLTLIFTVALMTHFVVVPFLLRNMIIFGRRKFATFLLCGAMLMWFSLLTFQQLGQPLPFADQAPYAGILILLPGLIANEIQRSHSLRVASGLAMVMSLTFCCTALIYEFTSVCRPFFILFYSAILAGLTLVLWVSQQWKTCNPSSATPMPEQGVIA